MSDNRQAPMAVCIPSRAHWHATASGKPPGFVREAKAVCGVTVHIPRRIFVEFRAPTCPRCEAILKSRRT
jgi:hypothetical protein